MCVSSFRFVHSLTHTYSPPLPPSPQITPKSLYPLPATSLPFAESALQPTASSSSSESTARASPGLQGEAWLSAGLAAWPELLCNALGQGKGWGAHGKRRGRGRGCFMKQQLSNSISLCCECSCSFNICLTTWSTAVWRYLSWLWLLLP